MFKNKNISLIRVYNIYIHIYSYIYIYKYTHYLVHLECIYPQVASPKLWIRKPQSTFSGWWFQPNQKDTVSWSQCLITNGKHQHTWNRKQVLSSLHLYGITLLSFWRFHSYVYLLFLLIRNWSKFYSPHAAWFHSHPIQKLPPSSNQTWQR